MGMPRRSERRRHDRIRLGGSAFLLVDPRRGLLGAKGHLIDLSEGGCQLSFGRHVDADLVGRVRLKLGGKALWFPLVTRQIVSDGVGWTVRSTFGGLATKKQDALRSLLFQLSVERGRRGGPDQTERRASRPSGRTLPTDATAIRVGGAPYASP